MTRLPLLLALAAAAPASAANDTVDVGTAEIRVELDLDAEDPWEAQLADVMQARAVELANRGGSRDLLAAALVWPGDRLPFRPRSGQADDTPASPPETWFARARAASPRDPLVDWIEATGCAGLARACDTEGATARVLAREGDNAAAHLLALAAARRAGDDDAVAHHLRMAATASRFELPRRRILALLVEAHAGIDWPEPDGALREKRAAMLGTTDPVSDEVASAMMAGARAMTFASPWSGEAVKACRGVDAGAAPARHADCMAVLALVAGDSSATRVAALAELVRMGAGDPAGERWRRALREVIWATERSGELMVGSQPRGMDVARFTQVLVEAGEIPAMQALLRAEGIPLEPPADWRPADRKMRELLAAGADGMR